MSTTKKRKPKVKLTPTNKLALCMTELEVDALKDFLESSKELMNDQMLKTRFNFDKATNMVFYDAINSIHRKNFAKLSLPEAQNNKITISIGQGAALWIFHNRIQKHMNSPVIEALRGIMEGIHQKLS